MGVALGEYELLKRLGAGGMGEVFLARPSKRDTRDDDRFIVIKTLLPHLADDEQTLTMFLDEARLAARLNHGNVCQIYELGESNGTWYIAMEYVSGRDCAKLLRNAAQQGERFSPEVACRIVSDAAAGLHYSHELTDGEGNPLGLVHRDVSPANILVTYEGGVKLIDFGVAKAAGRVHQTQAGQLKGKISYMSPEQAKGKALDNRSDIFSLGIVLHELLTGRKLFDADGQMEVLWAVCEANVTPPSEVDPTLPASLDPVVMKALTLSPDDRYSTAQEFRNALERWIITNGLNPTPGDVGALVSLLCDVDAKMERESGPLWDADLNVREITSIIDPQELEEAEGDEDEGPTLGPRGLRPPPEDEGEQPGGSTALYSNKGFDSPPPTAIEAPGSTTAEDADATMDAATSGMTAYERLAAGLPAEQERAKTDDEDQVNTSITENPLEVEAREEDATPPPGPPRAVTPPPPPPAAYVSGVQGDDDDEDELPETALNTPTSIITGDSDDDEDDPASVETAAGGALPTTRPHLPVAEEVAAPSSPAADGGRRSRLPLLLGLGAAVVILVGAGVGIALLTSGGGEDPAPPRVSGAPTDVAEAPEAPRRVALTVVTDPPGADALLNGRPIGKTPILSLPVSPAESATLKISRRGVKSLEERLELTEDLEVRYTLETTSVVVQVTSRPPGAKVSEEGEELGITPFEWHAQPGDTAVLKFAKKGYRPLEQSVTVEDGAEIAAVLKKARSGRRRSSDVFRPSSSIDPDDPPKRGPKIPTFGD